MTRHQTAPRTALVTGGNRGLGLETCRQLAERGFRVLLTSRGEDGKEAARQLAGKTHQVEQRSLDVADATSIATLTATLRRDGVAIDLLVANAGVSMNGFDLEVATKTLAVNFFGAAAVMDALLPLIPDGGNIVMVSSGMGELSSVSPALRARFLDAALSREALGALMRAFIADVGAGRHGAAGWPSSAYRVSKIGLNALVRIMAPTLATRRIAINAICPGWVRTDMGGAAAPRDVVTGAASIVWPATLAQPPTGGFFRDGRPLPW